MKKHILLTIFLSLCCAFGVSCFAQNGGVEVVIPGARSGSGTFRPHAPAAPLATGFFDLETCELELLFNSNVGVCNIAVTSTAGDAVFEAFDTESMLYNCTLSGNPGIYNISIALQDGSVTQAQFTIF